MTNRTAQGVPENLARQVADRLGGQLDQLSFEVEATGSQAACYAVSTDGAAAGSPILLKAFHPSYVRATPEYVAREFSALREFAAGIDDRDDLSCPNPLACFPEERAYLMGRVQGTPISSLIDRGRLSENELATARRLLLDALRLFYASVGSPYGDCHPENVFAKPSGTSLQLALIDPCMANPIYYQPTEWALFGPLSVDLAYWAFTEGARHWRAAIRRPSEVRRRLAFARGLIDVAVADAGSDGPALRQEIRQIVHWHARRFRDDPSARLTFVGLFARVVSPA